MNLRELKKKKIVKTMTYIIIRKCWNLTQKEENITCELLMLTPTNAQKVVITHFIIFIQSI